MRTIKPNPTGDPAFTGSYRNFGNLAHVVDLPHTCNLISALWLTPTPSSAKLSPITASSKNYAPSWRNRKSPRPHHFPRRGPLRVYLRALQHKWLARSWPRYEIPRPCHQAHRLLARPIRLQLLSRWNQDRLRVQSLWSQRNLDL